MYLKFRVSRETANDFIRLFVNRLAYGVQAAKPLPNGSVPYYLARDWLTKAPKHTRYRRGANAPEWRHYHQSVRDQS
jgi:hypothetical protein